jgi:hypothetical protein
MTPQARPSTVFLSGLFVLVLALYLLVRPDPATARQQAPAPVVPASTRPPTASPTPRPTPSPTRTPTPTPTATPAVPTPSPTLPATLPPSPTPTATLLPSP